MTPLRLPDARIQGRICDAMRCLLIVLLVAGVSHAVTIAGAFAAFAGYAPFALVQHRRLRRTAELRGLWPDAVDNLASAVRAGKSWRARSIK